MVSADRLGVDADSPAGVLLNGVQVIIPPVLRKAMNDSPEIAAAVEQLREAVVASFSAEGQ